MLVVNGTADGELSIQSEAQEVEQLRYPIPFFGAADERSLLS